MLTRSMRRRNGGDRLGGVGRSSASSPTCCAAATAAGAPGCAAWSGSPRTSSCWPPRSTWPASPPSACVTPAPADRSGRPDRPASYRLRAPAQHAELLQPVREHRPPRRPGLSVCHASSVSWTLLVRERLDTAVGCAQEASSVMPRKSPCSTTPSVALIAAASSARSQPGGTAQSRMWLASSVTRAAPSWSQHRGVPVRQHEPVPVEPFRVGRVAPHNPSTGRRPPGPAPWPRPMAAAGLLDGVHRQDADRVDGQPIEVHLGSCQSLGRYPHFLLPRRLGQLGPGSVGGGALGAVAGVEWADGPHRAQRAPGVFRDAASVVTRRRLLCPLMCPVGRWQLGRVW